MEEFDRSKPDLIYKQFADYLRSQIKRGKYKPGQHIPSERQFSKNLSLNRMTVRKGISLLVEEGLLQPLRGRGTFVIGYSEDKDKSKNIAFVFVRDSKFPLSQNPYFVEILEGAEAEASKLRYGFYLISVENNEEDIDSLASRLLNDKSISGIVFIGRIDTAFTGKLIVSVYGRAIPVVMIDHLIPYKSISTVVTDNSLGAYEAVKYIISLGHKKIGFISGPSGRQVTKERFEGYKKAMDESGIKIDEKLISESDLHIDGGYDAMMKMLGRAKEYPTAIFAINDESAIGAIKAIKEKKLDVPGDISVVGFDDIELSSHTTPPLTTMKVYKKEIGQISIQKVVQLIEGKNLLPVKSLMPASLVIRESCSKK